MRAGRTGSSLKAESVSAQSSETWGRMAGRAAPLRASRVPVSAAKGLGSFIAA
jgi:hypothetical protein